MGAQKNAGLSGGPKYNENVSMNGKNVPGVVVGQKLTVVGGRARVKIPVNCQKGDCGESYSVKSFDRIYERKLDILFSFKTIQIVTTSHHLHSAAII